MLEGHEEKIEELVGKVMGTREGSEGVAIGCMMSVVYYQWRCVTVYFLAVCISPQPTSARRCGTNPQTVTHIIQQCPCFTRTWAHLISIAPTSPCRPSLAPKKVKRRT